MKVSDAELLAIIQSDDRKAFDAFNELISKTFF